MSEIETDPMYCSGYNAALEWAANWITGAMGGYDDGTVEVLTAMAMTIRAAKMPIIQMPFADAILNDPFMSPELKAHWLKIANDNTARNSGGG